MTMYFIRLSLISFSLCIMLLALMAKLGQILPNSGIIAYTEVDELQEPRVMLLDVPTGSKIEITSAIREEALGRQPQWEANGESLSFWARYDRQNAYAYELQFSNYQLINLSERWHYFSLPLYAANNRRAFANNPTYANSPLYLIENGADEAHILIENVIAPQFSPDGKYLAYLAFYNPATDETISEEETIGIGFEIDLYTLNLETQETRNWTRHINTSGAPQFSPDSRYIVFTSQQRNRGIIYRLDLDNETIEQIPTDTAAISPPQWSANGRYLAFVSGLWDNLEIAVLDLQDMSLRNVSNHESYDVQPTWSQDSRLAFISRRNGQDEIYSYDLATEQLERLSYTPYNEADPVWRPR